jgi:hypothetical protein
MEGGMPGDAMSDRDGEKDAPASPADGSAVALDAKKPPPLDSLSSSYLLFEEFNSTMGQLSKVKGSWTIGSGKLRQTQLSYNGNYAKASIDAADYLVETTLSISEVYSSSLKNGAGIAVRIQAPSSSYPPRMYLCFVSPEEDLLDICRFSGHDSSCATQKYTSLIISRDIPYRLQLEVKGSTYSCSLPDENRTISLTDTGFPHTGDVGLITLQATASFEYLKVSAN